MNEGILQSSAVLQQMVAAGSNNWFTNNSLLAALPQNPIPHHFTPPPPPPPPLSWPPSHELPHSWSQLVLGFGGEEDEAEISHMHHSSMDAQLVTGAKEENTAACHTYAAGNLEFTGAKSTPVVKSCVSMFSNKSSENLMKCNSNSASGAAKKAKMNPTTSSQPGIKVRKQKLGDRITALHQIVSPFGKTDTASVLLEAIGYIRFLQRQIEALSLPYLGSGSGNIHVNVKRERSCLFPEDPGQLLNENDRKRKAISQKDCDEKPKKDLKSRGLCLVPLSCTVDFGSDNNGADYWAPAAFDGNFQ